MNFITTTKHDAAYPDRLVEWLFAFMMAAWGGYLFLPMQTFDNPQYAVLASIAPEQVWGTFSIAIATVRAVALFINGSWRRTPLFRFGCSVLGVVWWLSMIFMILSSAVEHLPAGVIWYPLFVVFEAVSCWRSMADAFHARAFQLRPARTDAK